ncbi:hypothetical protein HanRHA438_Chr04g0184811 [Helianthus annuus]|nr:hypothetical protein HanIR_Chr04g0203071 [Helianthus annuus]KAJ0927608.1 hypothetical protein HanRHA438_Chr04g0184811 [Helianthus annuus]
METDLTSRLDLHDQQIHQFHGDMAEIKATLQVLKADQEEQREFQKFFLNWMRQQDSRSNFSSISPFPASSSGFISPPPSLLAQLEAIVSRSDEHLKAIRSRSDEKSMAQFQSPSTQIVDVRSKFHEIEEESVNSTVTNSNLGIGCTSSLTSFDNQSADQAKLEMIGVNWAFSDVLKWNLGSDPVVGHDVELHTIMDLDYPYLGQGVEQKMIVGLIFSILKLHETGKAPFDRGNASLSHRLFNGMQLTISATWHLWVVHGQPRPPEDSSEEVFTLLIKVLRTRLF